VVRAEAEALEHVLFGAERVAHEDLHVDLPGGGGLQPGLVFLEEHMGEGAFGQRGVDLEHRLRGGDGGDQRAEGGEENGISQGVHHLGPFVQNRSGRWNRPCAITFSLLWVKKRHFRKFEGGGQWKDQKSAVPADLSARRIGGRRTA
jgi:hypothetical protein